MMMVGNCCSFISLSIKLSVGWDRIEPKQLRSSWRTLASRFELVIWPTLLTQTPVDPDTEGRGEHEPNDHNAG
jgi:hypothetical protein